MELDVELTLPAPAQETPMEAEQISVPKERPVLRVSSPGRLLAVSLVLGLAVDLLFYGKPLGISVLFFVLLLMGGLFLVGRLEGVRPRLVNLWLILPILFFAGL